MNASRTIPSPAQRLRTAASILATCWLAGASCATAADDEIERMDGSVVTGTVMKWTDAAVTLNAHGMVLEIASTQVRRVSIDGAADCGRDVVEVRGELADRRLEAGCRKLIVGLANHPGCPGLGVQALAYLQSREPVLSPAMAAELSRAASSFPEVRAFLMRRQDDTVTPEVLEEAAMKSLASVSGTEFAAARDRLRTKWTADLDAASAKGDDAAVRGIWLRLAQLYNAPGAVVGSPREFSVHHNRNVVDQILHAIEVVPLGADPAVAKTGLAQVRALGESGKQSAAAAARDRVLKYLVARGETLGEEFKATGDIDAFLSAGTAWKELIPADLRGEASLARLGRRLGEMLETERVAAGEYERLLKLGRAENPAFLAEIGSQMMRFSSSIYWTPARRSELETLKTTLAAKAVPTPAPATPGAATPAPAESPPGVPPGIPGVAPGAPTAAPLPGG